VRRCDRWVWLGLLVVGCRVDDPLAPVSESTDPDPPTIPELTVPAPEAEPPRVDCDALGLVQHRWWTNGFGRSIDPRSRAGDVILSTTRGTFDLAAGWSGCEVLLVLPDQPAQEGTDLWSEEALEDLLDELPAHALLLVGSRYGDDDWVEQVDGWADALDDPRLWVADEPLAEVEGWLGEAMSRFGWGFGVDRQQRIRYVGSFADVAKYNADIGWWDGSLVMAAHEVEHWEFEAERQAALDEVEVTEVDLFTGEVVQDPSWAGERSTTTVTLPADLDAFDTLEADLYLGCDGEGELGICPAWDYLVHLYLCAPGETTCSIEVGRWITTYHREGHWVHDLSPLLPLLPEGQATFQFYSQQPYEVNLSLRLSTRGVDRPSQAIELHRGSELTEEFAAREPLTVQVPTSTRKAELVTVISGHGQVGSGNCAEFCLLENVFTVGEVEEVRITYPKAGTEQGCENDVGNGTVPNQYGTWWFGRQGWCPGKQVEVERHDITDWVTPGEPVDIGYDVRQLGEDYVQEGARMDVSSWLVVYE